MTNLEFSSEFDILYNNISSNQAPGLTEYEKSVFLTKAQENLVVGYYSGRNINGYSFELTEESKRYLSKLVRIFTTSKPITLEGTPLEGYKGMSGNSVFFELPKDVLFKTHEAVILKDDKLKCNNTKYAEVTPVTQDTYDDISKNPFRKHSNKRVLRLDIGDNISELISEYNINDYVVHYIVKPKPIILIDLDNDISIDGISEETECELDSSLHRTILDTAVQLAVATMQMNMNINK